MARLPINLGESDAVLELCRRKTETEYDCEYYYHYELDGEQRLKNLLWADTDSQIDVIRGYGDVVVLDTTCRTNKHGVAFVTFMGLSHHRTPIVLGCGVTTDRSLDSLVFLLREYKSYRDGPTSVITDDGSDAVVGAVKTVFPGSNHRFCSRHVEQGIEEHLRGSSAAQNEFRALIDVRRRVFFPGGVPGPVVRLHGPMAKHRTAANQRWLDAMYGKREMWAAAFVHDKFFLGMANDQRTECLASALHAGLHEGMSLTEMWQHADDCTHALREDVAALDHQAAMSRVALTTEHRWIEDRAARMFTPANFYLLREEIKMLGSFDVLVETGGRHAGRALYAVGFKERRGVVFDVELLFDLEHDDVLKCSCRKMERDGLPCRHIFCVMNRTSMSKIPDCCVLRRMKRYLDEKFDRLDEMKDLAREVLDLASEDAQEYQEITKFFRTWLRERSGYVEAGTSRGSSGIAVEDDDGGPDTESSTPVAKKIKLFDD